MYNSIHEISNFNLKNSPSDPRLIGKKLFAKIEILPRNKIAVLIPKIHPRSVYGLNDFFTTFKVDKYI